MTRVPPPADNLAVALSLAKHAGWPLFPVHLNVVTKDDGTTRVEKKPAIKGWTEGAATTDPETLLAWFTIDFPEAWIGVFAEGAGIVVADLDADKGKGAGRDNLKAAGHKLGRSFHYPSRSPGSEHYIYDAPEGRTLTIGQGVPVPGVDIRAGHGLMVYYGPKLDGPPVLAPAPEWSLIDRGVSHSLTDTDASAWFKAQLPGKAPKKLRRMAETITERDCDRTIAMPFISEAVKAGSKAAPGIGSLLMEGRERYTRHYPDKVGDWDELVAGSIRKFGMPPVTFDVTPTEKAAIAQRNAPAAIEERKTERKVEWMTLRHDGKGPRILEDGPLAVELSEMLAERWAWTASTGLLRYDGKVWRAAEHASLIEAVRQGLEVIEIEEHARAIRSGDEHVKAAVAKVLTLLSRNRMRNVADLVLGIYMEHDLTADAHPDLLNVQNGVVNLVTGELMAHDPKYLFTRITAAEYHPDVDSSDWTLALEALPSKVLPWLQVRFGQATTGWTVPDAEVLFLKGGGENGKSAVLNGVRGALGTYAVDVPNQVLMANAGDHPTELTTLMGVRFAISEELPQGNVLNTKRLKDIAGTPIITARKMRQDFISWKATHTMFVTTNHDPVVLENDHGTWRRLLMVTFPYKFKKPGEEIKASTDRRADMTLRDRLGDTPNDAVLAWLVKGAVEWYARGKTMPTVPKRVAKDTREWRYSSDLVMRFVDERLELDPSSAIWVMDMQTEFNAWQDEQHVQQWSARTLASRFKGHEGLPDVDKRSTRFKPGMMPSRPPVRTTVVRKAPGNPAECWVGVRFKDEKPRIPESAEGLAFNAIVGSD